MTQNKTEITALIHAFWEAFEQAHDNLVDEDNNVNTELHFELSGKLKEIHEDLCLEIGHQTLPRELVISADGIDDVFEFVEMADAHKPTIPNWKIVKYRQALDDIEEKSITIGESTLELSDILFDLIIEDEVGIVVVMFIPGFEEENDTYEMLRWVILDNSIGEYDAAKKVGYFATYSMDAMKELDKKVTSEFKTLSHLKQDLNELWNEYNARAQ